MKFYLLIGLLGLGGSPSFSHAFVVPSSSSSSSQPLVSNHNHNHPSYSHTLRRQERTSSLQSLPKFFQQLSQTASTTNKNTNTFNPTTTTSSKTNAKDSTTTSQLHASTTVTKHNHNHKRTSNNKPQSNSFSSSTSPKPPSTPPKIFETRLSILQHALTEKTQLIQTLERRLKLVTDATHKLQISNRDLLSQLQVMTPSSPSSDDELEFQRQRLDQIQQELESSTKAYQSKLESKQEKYRSLQSAYRTLESKFKSLEQDYEERIQSEEVVTLLMTQLEASTLECEGLELQSVQHLEEIELLERELELMHEQTSTQQSQENAATSSGRISLETAPLEQKENKEVEDKIQSLQSDNESLQKQLSVMEQSYETAKQQFQELNQVYKDRRGKLESLLQNETDKSKSLKDALEQSQTETKQVRLEWTVVQETLERVQRQFHESQQRTQEVLHHSKVQQKNARISHKAYQLTKGRNEELKEQVRVLSSEKADLRSQLQQYQRMEREQFVDHNYWKEREEEWKSHIEGLYSHVAQLSNRCTTLRNEKENLTQSRKKERLEHETLHTKEKMEWKMNLVNLKSDYEELIEGFKTEINRLTPALIAEEINVNDDTTTSSNPEVTLVPTGQSLEKQSVSSTKKTTDEDVGVLLSKRKRVRRFLRNRVLDAKAWCARSTHRFSDSF